jgi:hypothetical protein
LTPLLLATSKGTDQRTAPHRGSEHWRTLITWRGPPAVKRTLRAPVCPALQSEPFAPHSVRDAPLHPSGSTALLYIMTLQGDAPAFGRTGPLPSLWRSLSSLISWQMLSHLCHSHATMMTVFLATLVTWASDRHIHTLISPTKTDVLPCLTMGVSWGLGGGRRAAKSKSSHPERGVAELNLPGPIDIAIKDPHLSPVSSSPQPGFHSSALGQRSNHKCPKSTSLGPVWLTF